MRHETWAQLEIWPWPETIDEELAKALLCENIDLDEQMPFDGESGCQVEEENGVRMLTVTDALANEGIDTWSQLYPLLRERGLAYHATHECSDGIDGAEQFWHPGMEKPFAALASRDGRVLDEGTFKRFLAEANDDKGVIADKVISFFSDNPHVWTGTP